jgi:hypothetical protein
VRVAKTKQSFVTCIPKQSLGTRGVVRPEIQANLSSDLRHLLALDDPLNDQLSATVTVRSGFLK